jgi:hypothetical protein
MDDSADAPARPDKPRSPLREGSESATRAPAVAGPRPLPGSQGLVDQLVAAFREQIRRSLHVELDDSETSLAFVDHYLRMVTDDQDSRSSGADWRVPIVALVAAGAGAYFGEVVRKQIGAMWIGDGRDPRRLRLLLTHQFLYLSPIDQAIEAIAGHSLGEDDPRIPEGAPFDPSFTLAPPRLHDDDDDDIVREHDEDAAWLQERLSELAPVPEDEFVSLTCRFETLKLMLELLAAKQVTEGKLPRQYTVDDYLAAMNG